MLKIKMSDFDLGHDEVVEALVELIKEAPELTEFDFSWASLGPRHLAMLGETFSDNAWKIRQLNLSYNTLHFMTESCTYAEPNKAATRERQKREARLATFTPPGSAEGQQRDEKISKKD